MGVYFAILVTMITEIWYWVPILTVFGLMFGSFVGAQVWRLRWVQLKADKAGGEPYDKQEYRRLKVLGERKDKHDRSKCLACGEQLRWYDLLPIVSWLSTGGTCRYCKKPIGWFELLIELGVAALFVISYMTWPWGLLTPLEIAMFIVWLVALVVGTTSFVYDLKWSLLPDGLTGILIVLGAVFASLQVVAGNASIISVLSALAVIAGVYAALYYVSYWRNGADNTWVGFGDVKLTIALGLFLGTWQLAFLTVFLANLIGTLIVLPLLVRGKVSRKAHIPFGPLLLVATAISVVYGQAIIGWYLQLFIP